MLGNVWVLDVQVSEQEGNTGRFILLADVVIYVFTPSFDGKEAGILSRKSVEDDGGGRRKLSSMTPVTAFDEPYTYVAADVTTNHDSLVHLQRLK